MANVLWLQGGACSGNTMSFLNAEEPTVVELITDFGLNILWQPLKKISLCCCFEYSANFPTTSAYIDIAKTVPIANPIIY